MSKMSLILLGLLSIFFQLSCQGQKIEKSKTVIESIIDPIEPMPFDVRRETMYLVLPDSLGGKNANGSSVLKLVINNEGKVQKFIIQKLYICKRDKEIVNYWNDNSATLEGKKCPLTILKYHDFFKLYVDRLEIIPTIGIKPAHENILYIGVRF